MEVVTELETLTRRDPAVLAIGVFDGVHRGHQAQLRQAGALAAKLGVRAVAVTFWPPPRRVLRPGEPLALLTTREQRLDLLAAQGVLDLTVEMPFTAALADLAPDDFLARLRQRFDVRGVVVRPTFAWGKDGAGDYDWLVESGARDGFLVQLSAIERDGLAIRSSAIRAQLGEGLVEAATQSLGRPYMLEGEVVRGDQRGRLLGFPTANLRLDPLQLIPANGVYAVRAGLASERGAARPGVANIGVRPTFGADNARLVEVHLLDAALDLYGQPLRVAFVARLREERRFPGLEALTAQIAADAAQARTLLALPVGSTDEGAPETELQGRETAD